MNKIQILLLMSIVVISGCVGQSGTVAYKNDIITVEDYIVSTLNPYSGRNVNIDFLIVNNGIKKVPRVEVNFFDIEGQSFELVNLECEKVNQNDVEDLKEKRCEFRDVDSLDSRKVSAVLKAPKDIKTKTTRTISYEINYDYSGYRQMNIPIILYDPPRKVRPVTKYKESSPEYGPIQLDFEPPVGSISRQGKQEVKEYWAVVTNDKRSFEVFMNFKNVGTITGGKALDGIIPKGNVRLELESIAVDQELSCVFGGSGVSKEDVKVPSKVSCSYYPLAFQGTETTGVLGVEFDYTYKYIRKETFTVLPLE